ncbi:hypothetical protein RQP50_23645 [Paenibacillus sp. chi10]|uniref:Uncharacterized protein n=1 Tax=Paenibacillus suaedae TaxID=3077233 RepID=A0AAJ2K0B6_9BACL|nr:MULTISPECIES: hypothetical protein [unclassified Paenibacillus]MDT8979236.1 hypothetical protein [Paenibacillus sp. chi10]GAV16044.1 aminopeptidase N [Paenibacillus sp. NAIST15-1]
MEIGKRLSSQLEGHSISEIVYRFITEPTTFENSVYDESYDILKRYCNNISGDEKYDTILSYYIEILNEQEVELKLYFSEKKRYLHAIEFYEDSPNLFDFQECLESKDIHVYVCKYEDFDWEYGVILLNKTKALEFRVNQSLGKYEIFQIEAPHVGEDKVERTSSRMRGIQTAYKEISFQDLQTSRFWKVKSRRWNSHEQPF